MEIALYITLGLVLIIVGFIIWFKVFYLQVPKLNIPKNTSQKEKTVLIDQWIQVLQSKRKFNGGILILKEHRPLLAKTYGFTNFNKSKHLDNNSAFRLASLSKQFTASGIMLLKEKTLINYDDLVLKYIPNFPYQNVTIRHLLNQTSGIPDSYIDLAKKTKKDIGILTNKKAVELILKHNPKPNFSPNDKYEYSNTNYIILARLIELATKQSFEHFMKANIFIPLGMNNTRVWNLISEDKTFQGKTEGFEDFANEVREIKPGFIDGVAGDGGVFSSINDFVIWDQFWYKNKLISVDNLQEAFKKPTLNNGTKSNYGFGWVILSDNTAMHNGNWLAANTYYVRNTKKKMGFVLLDNSSNMLFNKIIKNLIN